MFRNWSVHTVIVREEQDCEGRAELGGVASWPRVYVEHSASISHSILAETIV